jgi:glyoxylase-like metal-dependent hydrolase (beta-lactamase superfamily II)
MSEPRCLTIDCDYVFPRFAAAFLRIDGDEAAFIETNTALAVPKMLATLAAEALSPEAVRWIVVTHVHLDHAGGAGALLAACPNATVLAHPRAVRHLVDPARLVESATAVYGPERFRALYGDIAPIANERVQSLEDGASFALGRSTLSVLHTRGHANHHFVVHDPADGAVYTGDAFGLCYPALQRPGPFAFPSTSPTDFDAAEARKAIDRIVGLGARVARLTHFGEVTAIAEVGRQLHGWIDLSESILTRHAASALSGEPLAKAIEAELTDAMRVRAKEAGVELTPDDFALLETDLRLNAQGIGWVAEKSRKTSAAARDSSTQ